MFNYKTTRRIDLDRLKFVATRQSNDTYIYECLIDGNPIMKSSRSFLTLNEIRIEVEWLANLLGFEVQITQGFHEE